MTTEYPDMVVGAGTVLTTDQVDRAIAAGAKFIVSPGLDPKIVTYCIEKNIPITPGVVTPSEIAKAIELGLDVVKFFPAEPSGGLAMIKAVAAPYNKLRFMPTRRNQRKKCFTLPTIRQNHCVRWKLDGKKRSYQRRKI